MSLAPVLMLTASLVFSAVLLWLAAELAVQGSARPQGVRGMVWGVAAALTACALWWPANAVRSGAAGAYASVPAWSTALLAATALAALAGAIGALWQGGRRAWAVILATALPATTYVYAMLNAPGLLHLAEGPEWLGAGVPTLFMAAAVLAARLGCGASLLHRALRAGGAVVAALGACLGAALSVSVADAARWSLGPQWGVMPVLVVIAAVLLAVLRQGKGAGRSQTMRSTPAAATDHLTGLPSRLFFEGRLQAEVQRAAARSRRLAVFFIDLDGFQAGQRQFRPQQRRQGPRAGRPAPEGPGAGNQGGGAGRWRQVPAAGDRGEQPGKAWSNSRRA